MKKVILIFSILVFSVLLIFSQEIKPSLDIFQKVKNDSIIFFDNFDNYTPGESLFGQNPDDWFLDNSAPGPWSPKITDTFSLSNPNAVSFNLSWETIIKPMDNYDTGIYFIDFNLYFPENKTGAFYTFNYFDGEDIYYGMLVSFNESGQGSIFAGGFDSTIFDYNYNTWLANKVIVDINTNWAAFYLNEDLICSWVWSSGIYGGGEPKLLGGSQFVGHYYGDTEFLLDNYKLTRMDNSTFFDYFEVYESNEQLVCQFPNRWNTWNDLPCSTEDPIVIDTFAFEGSQSVLLQDSNNLLKTINNLTEGIYRVSFQMFIPIGEQGVFSILHEFNGDSSMVGCRMNFYSDGYLEIENGVFGQPVTYMPGTWLQNEIIIDLNENWAHYYLNDEYLGAWWWSFGINGQNNMNQFGGVNFEANSGIINQVQYFIDNFSIIELDSLPCIYPPQNLSYEIVNPEVVLVSWENPNCPNLLGYNIYLGGALIEFINGNSFYYNLSPGTYELCITAVYETGESDCAWITIVIVDKQEIEYQEISIYPNPAKNRIYINAKNKISRISMYNLSGQLQLESSCNFKKECYVNTSKLNPGMYLLKLETDTKTIHKRIVIQ